MVEVGGLTTIEVVEQNEVSSNNKNWALMFQRLKQ
jgi:hypothetical protein